MKKNENATTHAKYIVSSGMNYFANKSASQMWRMWRAVARILPPQELCSDRACLQLVKVRVFFLCCWFCMFLIDFRVYTLPRGGFSLASFVLQVQEQRLYKYKQFIVKTQSTTKCFVFLFVSYSLSIQHVFKYIEWMLLNSRDRYVSYFYF